MVHSALLEQSNPYDSTRTRMNASTPRPIGHSWELFYDIANSKEDQDLIHLLR